MSIELWMAFVVTSSVLLIIPGPTILTVISYSVAHGKRANMPLITAVALGDSTALLLSLAGLGALLVTSSWVFTMVKWAGGLYLIYLGITLLRSGKLPLDTASVEIIDARWRLFFNTWLVTALNPKGIIFFVAFLPQFLDVRLDITPQLWILSATFVLLATLNTALYAAFAGHARQILNSPKARRRFNYGGGSLLTIAGVWALTAEKPR